MTDKAQLIGTILPWVAVFVVAGVTGWVITTWMRIKHGYPLDGAWGQAVYPKKNEEVVERLKLVAQENAQLRADRIVALEQFSHDGLADDRNLRTDSHVGVFETAPRRKRPIANVEQLRPDALHLRRPIERAIDQGCVRRNLPRDADD